MLKVLEFLSKLSIFNLKYSNYSFEIAKSTDKEIAVFDTNTLLDKLWFETVVI